MACPNCGENDEEKLIRTPCCGYCKNCGASWDAEDEENGNITMG